MAHVAAEVAEQRIAAAVGAGGTIVDDGTAPSLTVIAEQDGNTGVVLRRRVPYDEGLTHRHGFQVGRVANDTLATTRTVGQQDEDAAPGQAPGGSIAQPR